MHACLGKAPHGTISGPTQAPEDGCALRLALVLVHQRCTSSHVASRLLSARLSLPCPLHTLRDDSGGSDRWNSWYLPRCVVNLREVLIWLNAEWRRRAGFLQRRPSYGNGLPRGQEAPLTSFPALPTPQALRSSMVMNFAPKNPGAGG
jgi:hypothetical protein